MKVGDKVYFSRNAKVNHGTVIAMRGDYVIVDDGSEDFRFLRSDGAYRDRVAACVAEATQQRKHASDARRRANESATEANTHEQNAIDLLAEANSLLRKQV